VEEAHAGDIIAIAGLSDTTIPDTICAAEQMTPLPAVPMLSRAPARCLSCETGCALAVAGVSR
jgi:predicted membrane GTPase involved in stress response